MTNVMTNAQMIADAYDVDVAAVDDAVAAGHVTLEGLEGLTDYPFAAVVAYAKHTGLPVTRLAIGDVCYQGQYDSAAEFARAACAEDCHGIKSYLLDCVDWQAVWDNSLRWDFFEADGFFFRNV